MSRVPNPYIGVTYIPDNERMETPPAWFLAQIHDYDTALVLFPSRMRPFAYVIARRSRLGMNLRHVDTVTQPDTLMCFSHGCVPVCMMFKHGAVWNADPILDTLRARDLWRQGGADAVADQLEAEELKTENDRRQAKRDELYHLSGDAWRSYQWRTGQRVSNGAGPTRPGAAVTSSSGSIPTGVEIVSA